MSAQAAAYQTATEPPPTSAPFKPRVFADYSIYKGKGALSLKAIKPEWKETATADVGINRAGSMFFEFAPSDQSGAQSGFGERRYEWGKKQTFALSPTEMGGFIVQDNFQMIHDPGKGRQNEGQVLKTLKVQAMPDGGVMLSLTVKDQQQPAANFYVGIPLTTAEYGVIKSLANFIIPRALGFDQIFAADSVAQEPSADMPPF